jgi:hypothetical protein
MSADYIRFSDKNFQPYIAYLKSEAQIQKAVYDKAIPAGRPFDVDQFPFIFFYNEYGAPYAPGEVEQGIEPLLREEYNALTEGTGQIDYSEPNLQAFQKRNVARVGKILSFEHRISGLKKPTSEEVQARLKELYYNNYPNRVVLPQGVGKNRTYYRSANPQLAQILKARLMSKKRAHSVPTKIKPILIGDDEIQIDEEPTDDSEHHFLYRRFRKE